MLSARYDIPHVATGAMLRDEIERGTELGAEARKAIESGELVADGLLRGLVLQRLQHDDCARGFLLDGFPKTVATNNPGRVTGFSVPPPPTALSAMVPASVPPA